MIADLPQHAFAIHPFLQAAKRPFDRLTFF